MNEIIAIKAAGQKEVITLKRNPNSGLQATINGISSGSGFQNKAVNIRDTLNPATNGGALLETQVPENGLIVTPLGGGSGSLPKANQQLSFPNVSIETGEDDLIPSSRGISNDPLRTPPHHSMEQQTRDTNENMAPAPPAATVPPPVVPVDPLPASSITPTTNPTPTSLQPTKRGFCRELLPNVASEASPNGCQDQEQPNERGPGLNSSLLPLSQPPLPPPALLPASEASPRPAPPPLIPIPSATEIDPQPRVPLTLGGSGILRTGISTPTLLQSLKRPPQESPPTPSGNRSLLANIKPEPMGNGFRSSQNENNTQRSLRVAAGPAPSALNPGTPTSPPPTIKLNPTSVVSYAVQKNQQQAFGSVPVIYSYGTGFNPTSAQASVPTPHHALDPAEGLNSALNLSAQSSHGLFRASVPSLLSRPSVDHHQQQQPLVGNHFVSHLQGHVPTSIPVSVVTSGHEIMRKYQHQSGLGSVTNHQDQAIQSYRTLTARKIGPAATASTFTRTTATTSSSGGLNSLKPPPVASGNPAKPYQCTLCGKHLASKNVYQLHLRSHSGEKPFSCSLCGNAFSQKTSLTRHMRSHTGERPFPCNICNKRFADKERIKIHMRTHTGEKPFSCDVCLKHFSQKSTVKRHMSVHTGEKPYKCSSCGKGFANRGNLTAHAKTHVSPS